MSENLKVTDNYLNERLQLLMEAVKNDRLEGETCPNCFERFSVPLLRELDVPILIPNVLKGKDKEVIELALSRIGSTRVHSILKKRVKDQDEIVKEYICGRCQRSYVGELDLIANQAETRVLSFFGYDESRIYDRDFYTFSVLDDSYGPFVKELWKASVRTTFDPQSMIDDAEDIITGSVLGQLRAFFEKFAEVVYQDLGASVKVYAPSHANKLELQTGADFAIWIGPLTPEDIQLLADFRNKKITFEQLPVRVGNGAIFQAKKGKTGTIDKKQIDDLVHYASIRYKEHDYFGIPGKLFMNYSPEPPYVTVLSCDYTYALYKRSLEENRKVWNFPKTLKDLGQYTKETELPDFIEAYLSGKAGTPLLMLRDVFGIDGPTLIIGLPPELLENPSESGHTLSGILGGWTSALGESLRLIEQQERMVAEQLRAHEEHVRAEKARQEQLRQQELEEERMLAERLRVQEEHVRAEKAHQERLRQEEQERQKRVVVQNQVRYRS